MAINNDMIEPSTNPNPGAEQIGEEGHRAEPSVEEKSAEGLAQEEVNANTTVNEPVSEERPAEQAQEDAPAEEEPTEQTEDAPVEEEPVEEPVQEKVEQETTNEEPVSEEPPAEQPEEEAPAEEEPVEEPLQEEVNQETTNEEPFSEEPPAEQTEEKVPAEEEPVEEPVQKEVEQETLSEEPIQEEPHAEQPQEDAPAEEEPLQEEVNQEPANEEPIQEEPPTEQAGEEPVEEEPVEEPVEEVVPVTVNLDPAADAPIQAVIPTEEIGDEEHAGEDRDDDDLSDDMPPPIVNFHPITGEPIYIDTVTGETVVVDADTGETIVVDSTTGEPVSDESDREREEDEERREKKPEEKEPEEEPVKEEPVKEEPKPEETAPAAEEAPVSTEPPKTIVTLEEYMEQICAGSMDLEGKEREARAAELSAMLNDKLKFVGSTEGERETTRDMRVYDPKSDRIVLFEALTGLADDINTDAPVFKDVAKLLLDGYTVFCPQRNGLGLPMTTDPLMLCGGEVDGKFHLQVHDRRTQEAMEKLDTTVKKPGFFDRVCDLFKRLVGKRDPICEIWSKYAPLRKLSRRQRAWSAEDHLYYARKNLNAMEEVSPELVQAFDNMVQQEQEISDASKNILDISCGGKVSNYQDNVDKNMRKLMLSGRGLYLHSNVAHFVEEKDFDWGSTPTMLGANREAIPGAALYGTLMAFALANQNRAFDGKPLNQVAMRALVSGNYEALATMKPYDSLVKPLQDAMAKAFVKEGGDSTEQGEKERREFEYWERRMLESGLERMQRELLQQPKLHDAWAIEMGRMLEGASILIMTEHEKLPLESKYLGNTFSGVSFFMQADVKLICNKQAVVERGIGADPESEAYRQAQQAMNDLVMAASTEDYSMLMDASDKADIEYRREIDSAKAFSNTKNRILTHMSEFAEPFIEELNEKAKEATFTLRFAHSHEYISLTGNEMRFWITAVALADQRGMNSEELRQFICGEKTDLPEEFRQELQTMMDDTDMDKKRTAFNTAMKRLDRELTAQKDLTTPYSRLLGDISALADPTFFRQTTMMLGSLYSNHMSRLDRRTGKEITVALEPGGRMGSLLYEISRLSTPTDTSNTMREIESSNEPYAPGSVKYHLEQVLLGKLAESYMNKVNGMQTSQERLSFLMKNEYAIKGLFQTAREFVSANAQKYSEDLALFKNAMRGGVVTDFNKFMHAMTKQAAPANEKTLPENNAEMVKEQPKTGPNL